MKSKEMILAYIDAENISYRKATKILNYIRKEGKSYDVRAYGRQKDQGTKGWSDVAKKSEIKDIRLYGKPEKNKVDKKIMKDMLRDIDKKDVSEVILVTSDGDYTKTVKGLCQQGVKVHVIGEKNKISKHLRKSGCKFIQI
ncbi:MAG: NYN domain-containing protein [Lachnospiraceae bacterium]|nr:NYN domain-containing protein [Lachnospiraceae bacterium]